MRKAGFIVLGGIVISGVLVYLSTRKAKAAPPPEGYVCPYCDQVFLTYENLVAHVQSVHPGERIPIDISWE